MKRIAYLYMEIYDQLIQDINTGLIKTGDKMPTEMELAERYGVSRITSKKALNLLADEGVVIRHKGLGSFVVKKDTQDNPAISATPVSVQPSTKTKVGLIMEDVGESYSMNLYYEIDRMAADTGYQICLAITYGNQDREKMVLRELIDLGVSGLIVMPAHGQHYNTDLLHLVLDHFPVVLIDRPLYGIPTPAVYTDNVTAAKKLTEHLIEKGHRNIIMISSMFNEAVSLQDRITGYKQAMRAADYAFADPIILKQFARYSNQKEMQAISGMNIEIIADHLTSNPSITAVIGTENGISILARKAALQIGRRIPDDLAIASFDERYGYIDDYTFTHIRQNASGIAKKALEVMSSLLDKQPINEMNDLVEADLVQGKTT